MEFGKGPPGDRAQLMRLPPDPPETASLLAATAAPAAREEPARGALRVGLSTWGDRAYRGTLYPADAPQSRFLEYYARRFTTVELSATFYGVPTEDRISRWQQSVPEAFRFLPKMSREATHVKRLRGAEPELTAFADRMRAFGAQLGPILLQLPPAFGPTGENAGLLSRAVATLGPGVAVELRHPGWFRAADPVATGRAGTGDAAPAARALAGTGASLCITDTVGAREVVHTILTAPRIVLRFVAAGDAGLDSDRAAAWVARLGDWLSKGLEEAYVYIHLGDPPAAVRLVEQFETGLAAHAIIPPAVPQNDVGDSPGAETGAAAGDSQLWLF
jgi:hypothetical protein